MENNYSKKQVIIYALISWFALISQFILIIENRVVGIPETILRYFSFFTILTNILVAVVYTTIWWQTKNKFSFFLKPNTQTAIGVYILIVGLVYNIILRFIWQPQGLQSVVDELLHLIIPVIYIIYWYFKVDKSSIKYVNSLNWLIYPLAYFIIILILGSYSNYYPYPFINVVELGYEKVILNSILLTLFFGFVSIVFVAISKSKK
jgi:hypothetical protein